MAAMGDPHPPAQRRQAALAEDLGDETGVLVDHELLPVAHRQAGRLLAAVLEGEEAKGREGRGLVAGGEHTDHAAPLSDPRRAGGGGTPRRAAGAPGPPRPDRRWRPRGPRAPPAG